MGRTVVPRNTRWGVLRIMHDESEHQGVDRTLAAIRNKYWFPRMRKVVTKYVRNCFKCLIGKSDTGRKPGLLHSIPKGETPLKVVHVDHLGPFVKSIEGNQYVIALQDGFTKYCFLEAAVAETNTKGILKQVEHLNRTIKHVECCYQRSTRRELV